MNQGSPVRTIKTYGLGRSLRRTTSRRGYSVIESVVVFGLVALISGAAFVVLNGRSAGVDAAAARSSLVHLLKLQAATSSAPTADLTILNDLDPGREYVDSGSADSSTVSVLVENGTKLAAATFDGVDCWMLVKDFAATTLDTREIWVVDKSSATCSAAHALQVVSPDDSGLTGRDSNRPRII
jgi:type II secretory pathway pseudopilin PulG